MYNTILSGDYILINKYSYKLRTPEYLPFTNISIPHFVINGLKSVHHGDIILFKPPSFINGKKTIFPNPFVKRCLGIPGDTLYLSNGMLCVNKSNVSLTLAQENKIDFKPEYFPIRIPMIGDTIHLSIFTNKMLLNIIISEGHKVRLCEDNFIYIDGKITKSYIVKKKYYLMIGDNSKYSYDSRIWGFISEDHLLGQVYAIAWSWSENSRNIRWNRIGKVL